MKRLLAFFLCLTSLPAIAADASGIKRVLVMDVKAIDCDHDDVASLPATIEKEIAKHPGFEIAPREKLPAAVTAGGASDSVACTGVSACLAKVAEQTSSSLIIGGSLEKKKKGYVLSLSLIDPKSPSQAPKESESMKRIGSLPMNVPIVLGRLFKWDDDMPVPPPEFELPPDDSSAPPPAAAGTPVIPRTQRIAVLSVKAEDVDASEAKGVPALIVKELASRKGYEAVNLDEVAAAIQKSGKDASGCATDKNCVMQVAEAVHADLVMTGIVSKGHGKYALQLNMSAPGAPQGSRTTETMKRLSSLPMNVPLCLDSLLK